jgi:hypothetical protein
MHAQLFPEFGIRGGRVRNLSKDLQLGRGQESLWQRPFSFDKEAPNSARDWDKVEQPTLRAF